MRVTDIKTVDVCVPLSSFGKYEPVTMWYGARYAAFKSILFIGTDEGVTGLGELKGGASAIQGIREWVIGQDPFDVNAIERRILNSGNVLHAIGLINDGMLSVVGALDMALWDIIGKTVGKPVHKFIGGKYREKVECRYWICSKDPEG